MRYFHDTPTAWKKASRMGQHLKQLDKMAHEPSHNDAVERRKQKKNQRKRATDDEEESTISNIGHDDDGDDGDDSAATKEEEEQETKFEQGTEEELPSLPDPDEVKKRMEKVVDGLAANFKTIRGAEVTPDIFDHVMVKAYGTSTALPAVAQVVLTTPNRATVTCFDPSLASAVGNAIRDAPGMSSFNPLMDENGAGIVIVPIPKVSVETRQALVKQLGSQAERSRQRLRNIRRAALAVVKQGKDGKLEGISKDDAFRVQKEVDTIMEIVTRKLNDMLEQKQASIMSV